MDRRRSGSASTTRRRTQGHQKLNGFSLGSEVNVLFSGQVHEYVGWQADFVATFGNQSAQPAITGQANILDLIAKFDFVDPCAGDRRTSRLDTAGVIPGSMNQAPLKSSDRKDQPCGRPRYAGGRRSRTLQSGREYWPGQ